VPEISEDSIFAHRTMIKAVKVSDNRSKRKVSDNRSKIEVKER